MGTTVWVDDETREALRRLQATFKDPSVNATIRRLIDARALDARTVFAKHRAGIREILRRHRLRGLVAFGSRARGDADATSDLDLAVRVSRGADALAILAAEAELEAEIGLPVRIVELPNPRLDEVIRREGIRFEP